jgi:hypothetical protein
VRYAHAYAGAHHRLCRQTYIGYDFADGIVSSHQTYLTDYRTGNQRAEQAERHTRKRVYEIAFYGAFKKSFDSASVCFRQLFFFGIFRIGRRFGNFFRDFAFAADGDFLFFVLHNRSSPILQLRKL